MAQFDEEKELEEIDDTTLDQALSLFLQQNEDSKKKSLNFFVIGSIYYDIFNNNINFVNYPTVQRNSNSLLWNHFSNNVKSDAQLIAQKPEWAKDSK